MIHVVAFPFLTYWNWMKIHKLDAGVLEVYGKKTVLVREKYQPSVCDLLRNRVLALGWSDGLASWASSVGGKCFIRPAAAELVLNGT